MFYVIQQLMRFMGVYRKYWLAPVVFGLLLLGGLLIVTQSSAISPFIYAIF